MVPALALENESESGLGEWGALAQGTCIASFRWDGGGQWNERLWTTELPDDSQLLLYLFCAFLESAGFTHPPTASSTPRPDAPRLYLATLPQRVPAGAPGHDPGPAGR